MLRNWDLCRAAVKVFRVHRLSAYLDFKEDMIELVAYLGKGKNKNVVRLGT